MRMSWRRRAKPRPSIADPDHSIAFNTRETTMTISQRVDFYAPIHKAYRAFMSDTLVRLGRIDVDDAAEAASVIAQVRALLASMRAHIEHENNFMHPAIEATGQVCASAAQHDEHGPEIAELELLAAGVAGAPRGDRDGLVHALYHRLSLLVADNFEHMLGEEVDNNRVLWAHYTDAQIIEVHDALVAAVEPAIFMEIMGWMLPALTPRELVQVVLGARAGAPPEAFDALLSLAASTLAPERWKKLQSALSFAAGSQTMPEPSLLA
jgi:iron-sulfur cluster repair protein YtfE (RIC family)